MSLASVFDIVEDIQEFCYVFGHVLYFRDLFNYFRSQFSVVGRYFDEKLKNRKDSHDIRVSKIFLLPYKSSASELHGISCFTNNKDLLSALCKISPNGMLLPLCSGTCELSVINELKSTVEGEKIEAAQCTVEDFLKEVSRQNSSLEDKIIHLEHEISNLKQQIIKLTPNYNCSAVVPLPPPPPPPPPPSVLSEHKKLNVLNDHQRKVLSTRNSKISAKDKKPDMVSILKGISNIKLRQTEKSPGGTPLRRQKPISVDDHSSLLKAALKKRYACMYLNDSLCQNEYSDKENANISWENASDELSF